MARGLLSGTFITFTLLAAFLGALCFWKLVTRPASWHVRLEVAATGTFLLACAYLLFLCCRWAVRPKDGMLWRKVGAYLNLALGLFMYAGSMVWCSYLTLWRYRWSGIYWMLPLILSFYGLLTWWVIKVCRFQISRSKT